MAIGTVATQKMIFYLNNTGYENIANIFKQLEGIQIYITTAIIGFVLFNFIRFLRVNFTKSI